MILTFRPIKVWPEGWQDPRRERLNSPFTAMYSDTLEILGRELDFLDAREATLQVAASSRDVRLDGQLRADAKVDHPGAILSIDTRRLGTLVYSCDRYVRQSWRSNSPARGSTTSEAIALGLEALRKVERYGIAERGQQYAGYRELPSGIPLGSGLTPEEAAAFLVEHGEWGDVAATVDDILDAEADVVADYFREAAKKLHPDRGGDPALFRRLVEARDLLDGILRARRS